MIGLLVAMMMNVSQKPPAGEVIFVDEFDGDLSAWTAELENGGRIEIVDGKLEIDVPGGCSLWLRRPLEGPLVIEYDITAISAGGANDRVSDLNCFWMATDARSPDDLFATPRSGKFADYNELRCYYVGMGGNSNTTTRFRRYIGDADRRPMLPEHDLTARQFLIEANRTYQIRLVADGSTVEFWRDGVRFFSFEDAEPYTRGHFAFRTVANHMRIDRIEIRRP